MFLNYLKISLRNLLRAKGYAFINIAGLAVGMSASVLIFLWISSELEFDRFYKKTDRLYQVYNRDVFNNEPTLWGTTPPPLAPELKSSYADIENVTRYAPLTLLFSVEDKNVNTQGAFADPDIFDVFDFQLLSGSRKDLLKEINGIVITRRLAENLFGTTDAIGKTIQMDHKDNFLVSAVMENLPENSQFKDRDYFLPWLFFQKPGWAKNEWNNNNYFTFLTLKEGVNVTAVEQKIKKVTANHLKGMIDDVAHREIFLHPAGKWYLYSKIENGKLVEGRIVTVRLFGIIAAFILLIACVNFVNLSTARSEKRAKEVGVRKVAGAPKGSLVLQFMTESVLLAFLASIFAALILVAAVPAFNNLIGRRLYPDLGSVYFWTSVIGFVLFTGLLAGSYPAFFLSSFQPSKVIKGIYTHAHAAFSPRKGLVVMQFTFAIILIISTLVIRKQIDYGESRASGYDKSNLLITALPGELEKHYTAVRDELVSSGVAVSATKSLGPAMSLNSRQWGVQFPGSVETDKNVEFDLFGADQNFVKTTGVTLLEGREIDLTKFPTDTTAVVLNETAVKAMRLKNAVGTVIRYQDTDWHVVGVVKDFIYESPYLPVKPAIIEGPGGLLPHQWISIRLSPKNPMAQNLKTAEGIFKKYNPGYPFEYSFADENYKSRFAQEQLTGALTGIFTGLAIFISCLGLFGLAAYTAQQRTKEIGVRKVLGASVASIVNLLTGNFVKLVIISFVIAAPIGWYAMREWLKDYDYRIDLDPGIFIMTVLAAMLIVVLTVSFQAINAALKNPVRSLRNE
ncbi:ABC transporter permease [Dyadobacter luticola]|uniref:FtsX-like permease family protein n=1 Tax=Dyadobacter luticola TaxID=1979387 RepID=A0A5R9KY72_9BACT|nr:ABC transporter permease [Dyadobacter luticola]TLV01020.1 FtsX-like permease family protein [Dyadobacter luticola]